MTYRYAEFVVKAPWFAPSVSGRGANVLQAGSGDRVWSRYQGQPDFTLDVNSLPGDRLELLAELENMGWEVVSVSFDDWTALLVIARRKV